MPQSTARKTAIVYGVYINPDAGWRRLIWAQLKDLHKSGVLSASDLHVIVTNPFGEKGVEDFFKSLPFSIKHITFSQDNKFEYPALSYLWDLAAACSEYEYIGYLHTKGMSYAKRRRDMNERALTRGTFFPMSEIMQKFKDSPEINKIGLFSSVQYIWFNFWWARSKYIRTLPRPEANQDRYSYEIWLGISTNPAEADCYSIWSNDSSSYSAIEALANLATLKRKLKYGRLFKLRILLMPLSNLETFLKSHFARMTR